MHGQEKRGKTAGAGAAAFINDGAGASQDAVVNAEQAGESSGVATLATSGSK